LIIDIAPTLKHSRRAPVSFRPERLSERMPLRREVQFLRERARRLMEMADAHQTGLSDQLRVMAAELDAVADRAERGITDEDGVGT
jgi:hypothetical protein